MPAGRDSPRPIVFSGLAVLLVLLLWTLRNIVILVGFAMLVAYLLDPLVSALERIRLPRAGHVPRGLAVTVVMLGLAFGLGWLGVIAVPHLAGEFAGFISRLPANAETLLAELRAWSESNQLAPYVAPSLDQLKANGPALLQQLGSAVGGWIGKLFGGLGQVLSFIMVPILAFYLLAERDAVRESALRFIPKSSHGLMHSIEVAVDRGLKSYVRGLSLVCLTMGIVVGLALAMLGVPLAAVLGVVVGAAELLPYIGATVAVVTIALVGYGAGPLTAAKGVVAYLVLNQLVGVLITPRLMGRHLKMHPFVVTLSVLAGGELLGPAGVILAVPGAAVIQSLMSEFAHPRTKEASELDPEVGETAIESRD